MQGGANSGLRAYGVALVVDAPQAKKGAAAGDAKAVLKRFWRPEEVSRDAAYTASFREVRCRPLSRGPVVTTCSHLPHAFHFAEASREPLCSSRKVHGSRIEHLTSHPRTTSVVAACLHKPPTFTGPSGSSPNAPMWLIMVSQVYASDDKQEVELAHIVGKCSIMPAGSALPGVLAFEHAC